MGLEKTLENPLDSRRSNQYILKEINSEYSLGGTDAEAEAPILRLPDSNSQLRGKDPDDGKDPVKEEKGATEDETVGYHHRLNGCEFEQTPGDAEGQGSLVRCSPWGHKVSDMT